MSMFEKPDGFKPLDLGDKNIFSTFLKQDQPLISELTFTNLFMWRLHYHPHWRESAGCLQVLYLPDDSAPFALQPFGPGDKAAALDDLCQQMTAAGYSPVVSRASKPFVDGFADSARYRVDPRPDHGDYVYRREDLASLAGRKYHQKKNHLNRFRKENDFELKVITRDIVPSVLMLQEDWCELRKCAEEPGLRNEDMAVYEALGHFDDLDIQGLAVFIQNKVAAFALGESLNDNTAVIHIEKADPDINGAYVAINHFFCRELLGGVEFVNREQDLGIEGLRRAKESYHPDHMVEKFDIKPLS